MTNSPTNERWQWLLILLVGVFAFGFRYYYVTHAEVLQPVNEANVRGDAVEYYNYARNLADHGVFSKAPAGTIPLIGDSYRDPGYPAFLAGWLKIFDQWDNWYAAALLSQTLLGALTVVLMLIFGRRWIPMRWLAAVGVLMAVWPHSVAMCSFLLAETLFGFLCALGLFLLGITFDRRSSRWAIASGAVLSIAALTNAVLLPFAPVLALYMHARRQMSTTMIVGLFAAALALIAPWLVRNAMLPSNNESSPGRALSNLVQGSWPLYHSAYQAAMKHDPAANTVMAVIDRETTTIQAHPMDGLSMIGRRMARHPGEYLLWYLGKPALFWDWSIRMGQGDIYVYPTRNSPFQANTAYRAVAALCHALNPLLFVLTIIGCTLALWPKQRIPPAVAATALMLLFVTLIYSTFQAEPRYSIPFRGPEIMLATFATYRISAWLTHLRKRTPATIA